MPRLPPSSAWPAKYSGWRSSGSALDRSVTSSSHGPNTSMSAPCSFKSDRARDCGLKRTARSVSLAFVGTGLLSVALNPNRISNRTLKRAQTFRSTAASKLGTFLTTKPVNNGLSQVADMDSTGPSHAARNIFALPLYTALGRLAIQLSYRPVQAFGHWVMLGIEGLKLGMLDD